MKIFNSLNQFERPENGCVLSIGNFDGLHRGHQKILRYARQLADNENLPLVGMTFDPAALKLLRPDRAPRILTPLEIKIKLLAQHGLDQLVIVRSTPEFFALPPQEFVESILVRQMGIKHIVEGQTFNFGQHRSGTIITLKQMGQKYHFKTHMISAVTEKFDQTPAVALNSTIIRQFVLSCQLDKARKSMGRDYMLAGSVVTGQGRGRKLGFPTANLELYDPDQLVPEDGVFAGWAQWDNSLDNAWRQTKRYPAAISIGRCETFPQGKWQVEAFLMDYQENQSNLTGAYMLISLVEKVREQKRFPNPQALTEAIKDDCLRIRNILKSEVNN